MADRLVFAEFHKSFGFYTSQGTDQKDQVDLADESARNTALLLDSRPSTARAQ